MQRRTFGVRIHPTPQSAGCTLRCPNLLTVEVLDVSRFYAPSSVRLSSLLMVSLLTLLAAPGAHAGSYVGANTVPVPGSSPVTYTQTPYSGGTYHGVGPAGQPVGSYSYTSSTSGYGAGTATNDGSASCAGAITSTFNWQPAYPGEPPPSANGVIVTETCMVSCWVLSPPAGSASAASCDDGLGQPGSKQSQNGVAQYSGPPNPVVVEYYASVAAKDTRYTANGGSLLSLSANPRATVSGSLAQRSEAILFYTVSVSHVTISLGGTLTDGNGNPVLDSSGNQQILVGQKCSATINGIPTGNGWTTTNASWTVSGSTFKGWVANNSSSTYTPYLDPNPTDSLSWYWNDLGPKPTAETVKCTATLTPPAGQGSAFTVTATQNVTVYVPGWTCTGTGGTMQVNTALNGSNGNYFLYAGPANTSTSGRGMEWSAKLIPPGAPFSGTGALELVQTETPNLTYTSTAGIVYNRSNNGQQGLDTSYDYGWDQPSTAPTYAAGDSPNISLTGVASAQLTYSFVDTLMYEPPNSSQYVPLATFTWSTNGSAQIPASKNWKDYGAGSAGTLTPTGKNNFTSSVAFPSWSQNVGVGWTWVAAK